MLDPRTATFAEVYEFMRQWVRQHNQPGVREPIFMILALVSLMLKTSCSSGTLWEILSSLRGADTPQGLKTGSGKINTVGRIRQWLGGAHGAIADETWTQFRQDFNQSVAVELSEVVHVDEKVLGENRHFSQHLLNALNRVGYLCKVKMGDTVPRLTEVVKDLYGVDIR